MVEIVEGFLTGENRGNREHRTLNVEHRTLNEETSHEYSHGGLPPLLDSDFGFSLLNLLLHRRQQIPILLKRLKLRKLLLNIIRRMEQKADIRLRQHRRIIE